MNRRALLPPGLAAGAWLLAAAARGAAAGLDAAWDDRGLSALSWQGSAVLADGRPVVTRVVLDASTNAANGERRSAFAAAPLEPARTNGNPAAHTVEMGYPWGRVVFAFAAASDRLVVDVTLHNTGTQALAGFALQPLVLRFPAVPDGWEKSLPRPSCSLDNVAVSRAVFGGQQVLACLDTLDPPMALGFGRPRDASRREYPLVWSGTVACVDPEKPVVHALGRARIEPGQGRTFRFSLRFAAADRPVEELAADLHDAFRKLYPPFNDWPDRRPIGMLMLHGGGKSATNPRGWFQKPALDLGTPAGKEDFRRLLADYARRAVDSLKALDAQGGVVWNVEGEENPHPITYIGDPRMLPVLAPEMDAEADAFFQAFRQAGLRTGVTIRPTQVYFNAEKKQWAHGTGSHGPERDPLKDNYDAVWPQGTPWYSFYPVVERMCRKIEYAKKRWGCTLFYIDTNGIFAPQGTDMKFEWMLLSGSMLRAIRQRHPDVLLIPELCEGDGTRHLTNWGYAAPYQELDMHGYGTPDAVRAVYPAAFSVVNIADGPIEEKRALLVQAVARGDILMARGWFPDSRNATVRAIYTEAEKARTTR